MTPYVLNINRIVFDEIDFSIGVAELFDSLPFPVKRIYWLKSSSRMLARGGHAHVNSQQLLIALRGKINLSLTDKLENHFKFELCDDDTGVVVPPNHWLELQMPADAILLCISSELYKDQVSVFDYEKFIGNK